MARNDHLSNKNNITGRSYIGQTSDFEKRKKSHLTHLRNNIHWNSELQKDFNEYGKSAFEFIIMISDLSEEDADIFEVALINEYYDDIYNINRNKTGGDIISYHPNNKSIGAIINRCRSTSFPNWYYADTNDKIVDQ